MSINRRDALLCTDRPQRPTQFVNHYAARPDHGATLVAGKQAHLQDHIDAKVAMIGSIGESDTATVLYDS
jgi:hypothetical protein